MANPTVPTRGGPHRKKKQLLLVRLLCVVLFISTGPPAGPGSEAFCISRVCHVCLYGYMYMPCRVMHMLRVLLVCLYGYIAIWLSCYLAL